MAKNKYTSASVINLASGTVRPGQTVALDDADAAALLATGMICPAVAEEKTAESNVPDATTEMKVKLEELEELNILLETKDREIAQLKEELAALKKAEDQEEKAEAAAEEKSSEEETEKAAKATKAKK